MENKMRRAEKEMQAQEAKEILINGEYGILSMITEDNNAYGIPLNYIYWDNKIYFHCAMEGFKLRSLRKNNKVSFCIVGETEVMPREISTKYESAIVSGRISEVGGEEKYNALVKFLEKYCLGYMEEGIKYLKKTIGKTVVLRIDIDNITGKRGK